VGVGVSVGVGVGAEVGVSVDIGVSVGVGVDVAVGIGVRVLGCLVVVTGVGDGVVAPVSVGVPESSDGEPQPASPPAETAAAIVRSRRLLIVGASPLSAMSWQLYCERPATTLALRA